jgi:hypothetical protein
LFSVRLSLSCLSRSLPLSICHPAYPSPHLTVTRANRKGSLKPALRRRQRLWFLRHGVGNARRTEAACPRREGRCLVLRGRFVWTQVVNCWRRAGERVGEGTVHASTSSSLSLFLSLSVCDLPHCRSHSPLHSASYIYICHLNPQKTRHNPRFVKGNVSLQMNHSFLKMFVFIFSNSLCVCLYVSPHLSPSLSIPLPLSSPLFFTSLTLTIYLHNPQWNASLGCRYRCVHCLACRQGEKRKG